MKLINFTLIFVFLLNSCEREPSEDKRCNKQYIIAGIATSCYMKTDIIPDSVISPFLENNSLKKSVKSTFESYVDMGLYSDNGFWNKIGNLDFQFKAYASFAAAGSIIDNGISLLTYDNDFLEYSVSTDSIFLEIYDFGDTIHNKDLWLKTDEIRLSRSSRILCPPSCPGEDYTINDSLIDKYIGIRVANQSDTSYSWFKLNVKEGYILTLKEFGRYRN